MSGRHMPFQGFGVVFVGLSVRPAFGMNLAGLAHIRTELLLWVDSVAKVVLPKVSKILRATGAVFV